MKKQLVKLGLTIFLSYGLVITNIQGETMNELFDSYSKLDKPLDEAIDSYLKNPQKSIDEVTRELVEKRQVGQRLALNNYFKKNEMNLADEMSRESIKKAPLLFKNMVEDNKFVLNFLKRYLERTAHTRFTNYMRRLSFPKPSKKQSRFINNYDKFNTCIDKFTDGYFEKFLSIDEQYINKLSKDEQDKLYMMSAKQYLELTDVSMRCMIYFNEVSDSYNALLPLK